MSFFNFALNDVLSVQSAISGRQQFTCKCLLKDVLTNSVRSLLCLDVCLPSRGIVAFQDQLTILT